MASAVAFDLTVDDKRPTLRLEALAERTSSAGLAAFMQGFAAPLLQSRAADRFDREGDEASGRWLPLAPATISRRENEGYVPIKINDRTGQMRAWVEQSQGKIKTPASGIATFEWPGTPDNRTIGRKLKVAQNGLGSPATPPRPVIAFDETDLLTIIAAIEQWVGSAQ